MESLPKNIHPSWNEYLLPLFQTDDMKKLKYEILPSINVEPARDNIFRVFETPLHDIKVVILGQDPYPNGEANGLAFAVNKDSVTPSSLTSIQEELFDDKTPSLRFASEWKTLEHWKEQGVFLLNTALTTEHGVKGAHLKLWQPFIKEVIHIISEHVGPTWLLWGRKAQDLAIPMVQKFAGPGRNAYFSAPHPVAHLYGKRDVSFIGCGHFKNLNNINW